MVTRGEVVKRARTMWPAGTIPYSQGRLGPYGYRQDCSGFVSMCWAIPPSENGGWGGQSTTLLVSNGYMVQISPSDLLPGDAVGICGPSTAGDDGHIVLFEEWANDDPYDSHYWAYEQAGGRAGPLHRIIDYPYDGSGGDWKAWRYVGIAEMFDGGIDMLTPVQEKQLGDTAFTVTNVPVVDDGGNKTTAMQPLHNAISTVDSRVTKTLRLVEDMSSPVDPVALALALAPAIVEELLSRIPRP